MIRHCECNIARRSCGIESKTFHRYIATVPVYLLLSRVFLWKDQQHKTGNIFFILLNTKTCVLPLCTAQSCVSAFPSHPSPRRQHTNLPSQYVSIKVPMSPKELKQLNIIGDPVLSRWDVTEQRHSVLLLLQGTLTSRKAPRGIEWRGMPVSMPIYITNCLVFHWTGASICWCSLILKQTLNVAVYDTLGNQQMLTFHAEGLHVASWEAQRFWPPLILVWLILIIKLWEPTEADIPLMKNLMPNSTLTNTMQEPVNAVIPSG